MVVVTNQNGIQFTILRFNGLTKPLLVCQSLSLQRFGQGLLCHLKNEVTLTSILINLLQFMTIEYSALPDKLVLTYACARMSQFLCNLFGHSKLLCQAVSLHYPKGHQFHRYHSHSYVALRTGFPSLDWIMQSRCITKGIYYFGTVNRSLGVKP